MSAGRPVGRQDSLVDPALDRAHADAKSFRRLKSAEVRRVIADSHRAPARCARFLRLGTRRAESLTLFIVTVMNGFFKTISVYCHNSLDFLNSGSINMNVMTDLIGRARLKEISRPGQNRLPPWP